MENKNDLINEYIDDLATKLNKEYPHILDESQITKAKNMFIDSNKDLDSIKREIDALAEQTIAEYLSLKEKQRVFKEMMKARREYLEKDYNIQIPDSKIESFSNNVLESNLSKEEVDKRLEIVDEGIKDDRRKSQLEEEIKSGNVTGVFSGIRKTINTIFSDENLSSKLAIYGGTIPYLLTGEEPKRIIGDVDTYASLDDMPAIRSYVSKNPDKYPILYDSLELTGEDYGMELSVHGTDVSIFPFIAKEDGFVVRNFNIQRAAGEITTQSTFFGGVNIKEQIINHNSDGTNIRIMSPEFTYITKRAANREKDIMDNHVLEKAINKDKLKQMSKSMESPETIETTKIQIPNNQNSFDKRSKKEVEIAKQIRTKNQMIANQKQNHSEKGKSLVKSSSNSSNNKGYTNIAILSLALSVAASMLSIIVYLIINQ